MFLISKGNAATQPSSFARRLALSQVSLSGLSQPCEFAAEHWKDSLLPRFAPFSSRAWSPVCWSAFHTCYRTNLQGSTAREKFQTSPMAAASKSVFTRIIGKVGLLSSIGTRSQEMPNTPPFRECLATDTSKTRSLLASIGNDLGASQFIELTLPPTPQKQDETWSDWRLATQRADLTPIPETERFALRHRIQPVDD